MLAPIVVLIGLYLTLRTDLIWNLADGIMGLMALTNLIAVALLSPIAMKLIKDYAKQRKEGKDPVFTRDRLPELKNIECWEDEESVTGSIGAMSREVRDKKHRTWFG